MNSSKQIKWGAIISYLAIAFNVVAGIIYTPWMIESIGKDNYALYSVALSIINIFLMDFGIGSAVTRFLSKYYAEGKREQADFFLGIVYKVFFIISAAIAVVLTVFYFLIDGIYTKFTPSELTVFKHLFIIVGLYSVLSFPCLAFRGILMANEEFIAVKLCNFGHKVFDVLLIVTFLLLGKGVYAMVLMHAISNFTFNGIRYLLIRFKIKQKASLHGWNKKQAKDLFGYSVWFTVISVAQRCMFNLMPTVIAALVGSVEVTLFSLAATLESYVYSFADAVNGMFMPKIARILAGDNSERELNSLFQKVGRFHVYTMGLVIIGFIGLGSQFIDLWLGAGYEKVYLCAVLIMLPSLVEVPQQVARTSLLALNIVKKQAIIYVFMAAINLIIAFLFVPLFGCIGAAIAIFVAYSFRTLVFNILYKKRLPVKLGQYFKKAYLGWIVPAVVAILCGVGMSGLFEKATIESFIISGVCVVAIYVVLLFAFAFSKEEKKKIVSMVFKKRISETL